MLCNLSPSTRAFSAGNLLVNGNCDLRICDFGLARGLFVSWAREEGTAELGPPAPSPPRDGVFIFQCAVNQLSVVLSSLFSTPSQTLSLRRGVITDNTVTRENSPNFTASPIPPYRPLPSSAWTRRREGKEGKSGGSVGTTDQGNGKGRSVVRPMGTAAYGGKGQGKGKGRGEGRLGQGGRGRSKDGEKPMGTTAYGGKGSKGRAANRDRPVGAVMPKPPLTATRL